MYPGLEILLIAIFTATACALVGVFLVLRNMALISDAISHSILPGIVVGFMITHDLGSPLLIVLATLSGLFTVVLVEWIQRSGWVKKDTAIGLVFPGMFSVGVLLIAQNANDVHLDADAVLLGELAFAPFNRIMLGGMDLGPKALWLTGIACVLCALLLLVFYKELKITTFDAALSSSLGFAPWIIHYGLMSLTSVVSVVAFDAVGAILVVALIIAPAASAYMLTYRLTYLLMLAVLFAILSALFGYALASFLDVSISGSMTFVLGIIFLVIYLFAPNRGYLAVVRKQNRQKKEVALLTLLLHLNNHQEVSERQVNHLQGHINWGTFQSKTILKLASENNFIAIENGLVNLSPKGQEFTQLALDYILANKNEKIEEMKAQFFLFRG